MITFSFVTLFLYFVQLDVSLLLEKPLVIVSDSGNISGILGVIERSEAYITIWNLFMTQYVSGL